MSIKKISIIFISAIISFMLAIECFVLFSSSDKKYTPPATVIGLVITDCEDDWKQEMYSTIQQAARNKNIQVTSIKTSRTQSDQIDAIRTLLVYRTDAIIFSPVMKNGWEYIISEAYNADIPLITINEKLSKNNNSDIPESITPVYHIGFDYYALSGQLASSMLYDNGGKDYHLIQLDGTVASSIAYDYSSGFRDVFKENGQDQQIFSVNGDYMRSRTYEVTNALMRNEYKIDVILSCNDAMTLGAIDALEENNLQPGRDVLIYSLGGGNTVMDAFQSKKINALGKCDLTQFGEVVIDSVQNLKKDGTLPETRLLDGTLYVNRSDDS